MSLEARLRRLERDAGRDEPASLPVVYVDDQDRVLDDGTEAIRPWVGQHHGELPLRILKLLIGLGPFAI